MLFLFFSFLIDRGWVDSAIWELRGCRLRGAHGKRGECVWCSSSALIGL